MPEAENRQAVETGFTLAAAVNIPGFSAEWAAVQEGKRYNIKVTFQPPEKKKPKQTHIGEMTVTTNDPREPELRVKLVARSR